MLKSKTRTVFSCLILLSQLWFCTSAVHAAEPSSRDLNSGWQFRILIAEQARAHPELQQWHPAQVPGVVQTDLLENHLIPDPFYRDNESRLQWIGESDWEYQTTFQLDAPALAHEHLDLVFEGLDTFADVSLNGHSILESDNMFRRWRIPVKTLLVVDLGIGGKAVSQNTVYFDITHNLELPVVPKIESTLAKSGNGYTLTLKSPLLARSVYISFGDLDVQTSDNYFELLPNEAVSIILKTSATLNRTQSALKIVSLTEAFASPGTHY
jgi:beta-galactosidase/beta-glucuronidase